ncbi:MAG: leucine/isoleucine/valine transporter permease subunit [Chloroflexi bacterium]|nr:leucine/isoleucine/valine transporter permease subunit [Chloroflexota bacterium]
MKTIQWRTTLRYGLLGGVAALYFSAIGMVELFAGRNLVGTTINMGHILLYGGVVAAGFLAARSEAHARLPQRLVIGLVAGLVAAVPTIALVLLDSVWDMEAIFVSMNNPLIRLLTLGRGLPGLGMFLAVCGALGLAGGGYNSMPGEHKAAGARALALVLIVAIFSDLVTQVMSNLFGRGSLSLFFAGKALKPAVAIVLFVLMGAVFYFRAVRKARTPLDPEKVKVDKRTRLQRQVVQFVVVGIILLVAPQVLGSFLSQVLFEVGRFVLLGLGLNIVVGYAGLLDLGYVAFFAVGAYTMGLLTTATGLNMGGGVMNFWLALPVAVLISVLFGILLGFPVLSLRGDYLAIVTLGFGEIVRILALSDWLKPIMGGAQGVLFIPTPHIFGVTFDTPQKMYYLVVLGALLAAFVSIRLRDSRLGRQWMAMREDEDVAEAMGINLVQTKLLAFAIGAGFSGLGGAIFAARLGNVFPHSFNLLISLNALSLIIVGGMGSIPGVIVGAVALVGLPELLREFQEYRLLIYGILLIVMMLNRPEGFLPAEVFKRELHAEEGELAGTGD